MERKNKRFRYFFEEQMINIFLIMGVSIFSVGIALQLSEEGLSSGHILLIGFIFVVVALFIKALYNWSWVRKREKGQKDFVDAFFMPR